jgi:hypothetical protein
MRAGLARLGLHTKRSRTPQMFFRLPPRVVFDQINSKRPIGARKNSDRMVYGAVVSVPFSPRAFHSGQC